MTEKHRRAKYTPEFKMEAVRQVSSGQAIAVVAKVLGVPSLGNWVRLAAQGQLSGVGADSAAAKVSPEQMELARLRAANARLRMERDIAKNAAAYFAQDTLRGTPGFAK
jgi:transposase